MNSSAKAPAGEVDSTIPYCKSLPIEYTAPMGQVMVDWAFYEMRLQELVWLALNISDKQGRLAMRSMPAVDLYATAVDLFVLEGISLPEANTGTQKELAKRRNLLAHGIWMTDGENYYLRDLTGSVNVDGVKVKSKILPKGVPLTPASILSLSKSIQQAIADIEMLIQAVIRQRSSSK